MIEFSKSGVSCRKLFLGGTKVEIFRVLGNNCLMSIDKHGREVILIGSGIGFKKKKGDFIEVGKISSLFVALPAVCKNLDTSPL